MNKQRTSDKSEVRVARQMHKKTGTSLQAKVPVFYVFFSAYSR